MNCNSKRLNPPRIISNISHIQDSNSNSLIENFGFPSNFFSQINEYTNSVISSQNEIIKNSKKLYEKENEESFLNSTKKTDNELNKLDNLYNPQMHFEYLSNNLNSENDSTQMVKAYKSKHKKKYIKIYEANSKNFNKDNKNKLFHKCSFPGCNRTFSSSGWLKAHLKIHLKQIHNSLFCKLFRNIVINNKIELMNQFNNNYFRQQIINENNKNVFSNKQNL